VCVMIVIQLSRGSLINSEELSRKEMFTLNFTQIQQENKIIRKIGRIDNPFYPEEVTAKYLILCIEFVGIYKGDEEKANFICHLIDSHLPTIETPREFKKRIMNEHVWINSHLSRLVAEYAVARLGMGSKGSRMVGQAVIRRQFLLMAAGEVFGLRFVYQKVAQVNKNFNSVIELEYDGKMSRPGLVVIRKRTKRHYLNRLHQDLGEDLVHDALEMDDQLTKGALESVSMVVNIMGESGQVIREPYCELRGDDFCEYHIQVREEDDGVFKVVQGALRSTFSRFLFLIPLVKKMGEKLVAMEIAIQKQTRDLSDSQIRLEERVMQRIRELRELNAHLVRTEEREKKILADKIHEGIAQELAMSRILIGQLAHEHSDPSAQESFDQLKHHMDQVIGDIRDMTNDLSPPVLHELGLEDALIWLGEKVEKEYHILVLLDIIPGEEAITVDNSVMIFRVVQELFVNSIRHAKADRIALRFTRTKEMICLIVEDNGVGFDPALLDAFGTPENAGYGLYSIRDRIRYAGGRFDLESAPGNGCKASLTLPYPM